MRVLIISHAYSEPHWFTLPEALAADDLEVTLIAPAFVPSIALWEHRAPPSTRRVEAIAARTLSRNGHFIFMPSWRVYRRLKPDVVHVEYDPWTPEFWSVFVPLVLLYPKSRWILLTKKNTRHIPRGPLGLVERFLTFVGLSRVRLIIAVSRRTAGVYERLGYGAKRTVVASHVPLDDAFQPAPDHGESGPFRVGFVGHVGPHKGVPELLDAVDLARRTSGHDIRLDLVGPAFHPPTQDVINIHDWATLHQPMPNREVPAFLQTLDAFAMPSLILPDHEEHDAHALLEAMATALPCLGSRSGIIPELIEHEVNGLLHEPGDIPTLAAQIVDLVENPSLRRTLARRARPAALERASLATLTRQRRTMYSEVVNAKSQQLK